jgi:hypothetical protein
VAVSWALHSVPPPVLVQLRELLAGALEEGLKEATMVPWQVPSPGPSSDMELALQQACCKLGLPTADSSQAADARATMREWGLISMQVSRRDLIWRYGAQYFGVPMGLVVGLLSWARHMGWPPTNVLQFMVVMLIWVVSGALWGALFGRILDWFLNPVK